MKTNEIKTSGLKTINEYKDMYITILHNVDGPEMNTLLQELYDNFINENAKFKFGDIVKYKGRKCIVTNVEINDSDNERYHSPIGIIYYLDYEKTNKPVNEYKGIAEEHIMKYNN